MTSLNKYIKLIPYLYFLSLIFYWFIDFNKSNNLTAYPILLFGIPFVWQLIRPSRKLNFSLGIIFVCLSSYLILAYFFNLLNIIDWTESSQKLLLYGGFFVLSNFIMSLWIIRNSMRKTF